MKKILLAILMTAIGFCTPEYKLYSDINMNENKIINVADGESANDAVNKGQLDDAALVLASTKLSKSGGTMTGDIDMDGRAIHNINYIDNLLRVDNLYSIGVIGSISTLNKINSNVSMENHVISNLANGVSANDAVNKGQLDSAVSGLATIAYTDTKLSKSGGTMTDTLNIDQGTFGRLRLERADVKGSYEVDGGGDVISRIELIPHMNHGGSALTFQHVQGWVSPEKNKGTAFVPMTFTQPVQFNDGIIITGAVEFNVSGGTDTELNKDGLTIGQNPYPTKLRQLFLEFNDHFNPLPGHTTKIEHQYGGDAISGTDWSRLNIDNDLRVQGNFTVDTGNSVSLPANATVGGVQIATVDDVDTKVSINNTKVNGAITSIGYNDLVLAGSENSGNGGGNIILRPKDCDSVPGGNIILETPGSSAYPQNIIINAKDDGTPGDFIIVSSAMNSPSSVVTKAYVDSHSGGGTDLTTVSNQFLLKSGGTMTGDIDMYGHNISNIVNINYIGGIDSIGIIKDINGIEDIVEISTINYIGIIDYIETLNKINSNVSMENHVISNLAAGVSANDAVNLGQLDAAISAVQTVQETTVTNISDYVSLNNISNYIYVVECTSATSGPTNALLSSYITIKDLNGNFITEQVCLDIVLDNTDYDTFSTYEGEVINLSTLKHYKHIITDGACTIALWRNKSGSTQIKMYVTYGQSTDQTTFNFSN